MRIAIASLFACLAVAGIALPSEIPVPRPIPSEQDVGRMMARSKRFAEAGEIDLFVASTAAWKLNLKDDDNRLWEPATRIGQEVVKKACNMDMDRTPQGPAIFREFNSFRENRKPRFVRANGIYRRSPQERASQPVILYLDEVIEADGVENPWSIRGLIMARGHVKTPGPINDALILANGDVEAGNKMFTSLIICDGDVRVKEIIGRSVVIARGKITVESTVKTSIYSTLIAGGTITANAEPPGPGPFRSARTDIFSGESKPLGYIRFFELDRIGLAVETMNGVVKVREVKPGGIFDKSGGQVGDVLSLVDRKRPDSTDTFRRLLRNSLAIGDATVTVKRGEKTATLSIALP